MRVDDLIIELQEMVNDAKNMPLTGKAMIDREQALQILDELQDTMPREFMQAKAIANDRQKILDEAKSESEAIIKVAEERKRALIDQQEITKLANKKAKEIIEDATKQSKELKKAANSYVDEVMRKTDEAVTQQLAELRKVRQSVKAAAQKS